MSDRVFNLARVELPRYDEGPPGHRFAYRSFGDALGTKATGMTVYELEPGEASWPYHFEVAEEELLFVIAGELTLRTPDRERTLRAGDIVAFPAGAAGAHAVRNEGTEVARYAMPSSRAPYGAATIYPDSDTFQIYGPGFHHRGRLGEKTEYWDGHS
jgi:uncharacterized cupin superfamily protein